MTITNKYNLPDVFVRLARAYQDSYLADFDVDDFGKKISVTTLIGPPVLAYLKAKHRHEVVVDVLDLWYSLNGSIKHTILEKVEIPNAVNEKRFECTKGGVIISGKADVWHVKDKHIQDYKTMSADSWKYHKDAPKPEWVYQLNVLKYIWEMNGIEIDKLSISAIYVDLKKKDRFDKNMPPTPSITYPIRIMSRQEIERYINARVEYHLNVYCEMNAHGIKHCTEEERWHKPDLWKVKTIEKDRTIPGGLCTSLEQAEALLAVKGSKYKIDFVKGYDTLCMDYCEVKDFCPLWKDKKDDKREPSVVGILHDIVAKNAGEGQGSISTESY